MVKARGVIYKNITPCWLDRYFMKNYVFCVFWGQDFFKIFIDKKY